MPAKRLRVPTRVFPRPPALLWRSIPPAAELRAYLAEHPDQSQAENQQLVSTLIWEGAFEEALQVARATVERCPEDPQRIALLASVLIELGQFADAADAYRDALRLGWVDVGGRTHLRMGDLLYNAGRLDEAREAWRQAIRESDLNHRTELEDHVPRWARPILRQLVPAKRKAQARLRRY
jgi:tetratricopeptide (TPR) repeat protein